VLEKEKQQDKKPVTVATRSGSVKTRADLMEEKKEIP